MIVLSQSLVLSSVQIYDPDNPVIGWHNLVNTDSLTADSETPGFPAVNLCNPNTVLKWKSATTALQYLTVVTTDYSGPIDYIAIARHNFGSTAQRVRIEGQTVIAGAWDVLFDEIIVADDSPIIFRFVPTNLVGIRMRLRLGSSPPTGAVLYTGKLLVMERGLYVGHTPLRYARRTDAIDGLAESGDYLGSIILGEYRESSAKFSQINPDWFRANLEPFLIDAASLRNPFFFGWRPTTYPFESGFARLISDPWPVPDSTSHLTEIELQMRAIP